MALAWVGSMDEAGGGTNAQHDFTIDVGVGSNRFLLVGFFFFNVTDLSGTPTYAGVSMTQILAGNSTDVSANRVNYYLYGLKAPTSGSNTLSVTGTTSGDHVRCSASWFTGVSQITGYEGATVATSPASAPQTVSVTTTVNGDWVVGFYDTSANPTADSNTTFRPSSPDSVGMFDTNAAQTPAGVHSCGYTSNNKGVMLACGLIDVSPPVGGATLNPLLMGV